MKEQDGKKPYLDAPVKDVETTKEQLIYGGGETLQEKDDKHKGKQPLNEAPVRRG